MYFKNITMQLPSHAQIQVVPAENILVHPTIAFKISAFSQTSHCHKGCRTEFVIAITQVF